MSTAYGRQLFRHDGGKRGYFERSAGPNVTAEDEVVTMVVDAEAMAEISRERGARGITHLFDDLRNRLAKDKFNTPDDQLLTADFRNPRQEHVYTQSNGIKCVAIAQKVDD